MKTRALMPRSLVSLFDIMYPGMLKEPPDVSGIDLAKEIELIKQKKSKLSRAKRDYIVKMFKNETNKE